jgi:hypothetical protein
MEDNTYRAQGSHQEGMGGVYELYHAKGEGDIPE